MYVPRAIAAAPAMTMNGSVPEGALAAATARVLAASEGLVIFLLPASMDHGSAELRGP